MSSTRPRLDTLEVEVLTIILEYVEFTSSPTLKSVSLVSRYLNSVAKLVSHRQKVITFGADHNPANSRLARWMEDDQLLRRLRHLTIDQEISSYRETDGLNLAKIESLDYKWHALIALLQKSASLTAVEWCHSDPVPLQVIMALEQYQKRAELQILRWVRKDASRRCGEDPHEAALAKCAALTAIHTDIWTHGHGPALDLRQAAFYRIVACAPNLKSVSLSTGHSGCVMRCLTIEGMEEHHAAEEDFFTDLNPNPSVTRVSLDGCMLGLDLLTYLSRFVVLANLSSLETTRTYANDLDFYAHCSTLLPNLKHVDLQLSRHDALAQNLAAERYITECGPLESLVLQSWHGLSSLERVLERHGSTLRTLQLHESEIGALREAPRRLLSMEELHLIHNACPELRDFTMDMKRKTRGLNVEDDIEMFQTLSRMNLDRLQLYYDLGLDSMLMFNRLIHPANGDGNNQTESSQQEQSAPLEPSQHDDIERYVEDAWKIVFGSRTMGDRALDVKFGEWEFILGGGRPANWVLAHEDNKTFWKIRPSE